MYRHCIYCSANLGSNDSIEAFPVGKSLAFDAARGRLWAVCPRCARWNLAPLEERWEAVEAAEKRFADTRVRAQSENVGLARLADGTRLVRVGAAQAGELAAWRYGHEPARRGWTWSAREAAADGLATVGAYAAGSAAALALSPLMLAALLVGEDRNGSAPRRSPGALLERVEEGVAAYARLRAERPVVHTLPAGRSPTGAPLSLRRWHLRGAWLAPDGERGVALHVPPAEPLRLLLPGASLEGLAHPVELNGPEALAALGRVMVGVNPRGARRQTLPYVLGEVARAPTAAEYLREMAGRGVALQLPAQARMRAYLDARARVDDVSPGLRKIWERRVERTVAGAAYGGTVLGLALEMALHEETERRAMEGELALLESAWREAEAIAAIADRLAVAADPSADRDAPKSIAADPAKPAAADLPASIASDLPK